MQKWVRVLTRGWMILLIGAAAGSAIAWGLTSRTPQQFEAIATIQLTAATTHPSGLFSIPGVRTVLGHHEIAAAVVQEFRLADPPHRLTAQSLLADAYVLEQIPNTYLLRQKVRLLQPELAAQVAGRMAERGVELAAQLWQETGSGLAQLEGQAEEARLALANAEQRMLAYRKRAGLDLPREGLSRRGEQGRSEIARLYAKELDLVRLETEVETRRRVFIDLAVRHEQARIELAFTLPPLRLIERPVIPERPLPSNRSRTIGLGVLAGLIVGMCVVIARDWRERPLSGELTPARQDSEPAAGGGERQDSESSAMPAPAPDAGMSL